MTVLCSLLCVCRSMNHLLTIQEFFHTQANNKEFIFSQTRDITGRLKAPTWHNKQQKELRTPDQPLQPHLPLPPVCFTSWLHPRWRLTEDTDTCGTETAILNKSAQLVTILLIHYPHEFSPKSSRSMFKVTETINDTHIHCVIVWSTKTPFISKENCLLHDSLKYCSHVVILFIYFYGPDYEFVFRWTGKICTRSFQLCLASAEAEQTGQSLEQAVECARQEEMTLMLTYPEK